MASFGWIGIDLDKTLATADHREPYIPTHVGEPIWPMVNFVKDLIAQGYEVRIFTARASEPDLTLRIAMEIAIREWCEKHIGQPLGITCVKDYQCVRIYDDRAVQVEPNTGRIIRDLEIN